MCLFPMNKSGSCQYPLEQAELNSLQLQLIFMPAKYTDDAEGERTSLCITQKSNSSLHLTFIVQSLE